MFKKFLYAFCALLALSCKTYAIGDDLSSLVEDKGSRNTLRSSIASWGGDQELAEASSSSSTSSIPNSLFPNGYAKATLTWSELVAAAERGEPQAKKLHDLLVEKYADDMAWNQKPLHAMPFSQSQLLVSRFVARKIAFEAFKVDADRLVEELKAWLEEKTTQNLRSQSAAKDVQAEIIKEDFITEGVFPELINLF